MTHERPLPAITLALARVTRDNPTARKIFIVPDVNYGRELLAELARTLGGWIGWEATTLRQIADELIFVALHQQDMQIAGDIRIRVLVNQAFDRAVSQGHVRQLAILHHSLGFRETLRNSILELRMAGISAEELRESVAKEPEGFISESVREVAAVLTEYESSLTHHRYADASTVFRMALEEFDREHLHVIDGIVVVAPSVLNRGIPGQLLQRLLLTGAQSLPGDTPELDRNAVTLDLFAAVTPSEELREVHRRVLAEELSWDDVEIVATDVDTYGIALDILCQQLGLSATMLHGIPLDRTRIGRALERWFGWLQEGLPADMLREALESGEIALSSTSSTDTNPSLARDLRAARIGWGRARYEQTIAGIESGLALNRLKPREDESPDAFTARTEAHRTSLSTLATWLRGIIEVVPAIPERGSTTIVRCAPAALAQATLTWVSLIPAHAPAEQQTLDRIRSRLAQLETDTNEVGFATAIAIVRDALSDVRAWPTTNTEHKPWRSAGGMVHLTDLPHAGTSGRRRTFVVGLDADRIGGARQQDPLLPDSIRLALGNQRLSTTNQRREEKNLQLYSALASLRGRVTMSYAVSSTLDGREAGPGVVLLQALRLMRNDDSLSYKELRSEILPPVCAVPARDAAGTLQKIALLDTRDVWLDSLTDGALLLDGEILVREAFPPLDTGLRALTMAGEAAITPYHGLVARAAGTFDPTAQSHRAISPSALELLSRCPLAWYYQYGLALTPPDDPEYDFNRWLDARDRGSLLHEIFEKFSTAYTGRQAELGHPEARETLDTITTTILQRWRDKVPPPGDAVFQSEASELRRAAFTFLEMERRSLEQGDPGEWRYLEFAFGWDKTPAHYMLDETRSLTVRGRVDRIDRMPDSTLRVIDYKTGRSDGFAKNPKLGMFNGGRQLQAALYTAVLENILGQPVSSFEYRFPTEKGNNEIVPYTAGELREARPLIVRLLEYLRTGHFIPTTDSNDCKICNYRAICRVEVDKYYKVTSPRADWAELNASSHPEYTTMLARRSQDVES